MHQENHMMNPLLTVVISTHNQLDHELPLILHSLALQTDKRFEIQIWHDGRDDYERAAYEDWVMMFPIDFAKPKCTEERTNDFGYSQRNLALAQATTKYICFAAADQYYIPHFTYYFLKKMEEENLDFAWCNFIHQYLDRSNLPYSLFDSTMDRCRIDISNFMVKTELAKQIMFDLSDPRFADGNFVESFKAKFPEARCGKLEQILVCHN